jgi:tetratricopeptide (TPR) repeat protein
MTGRSNRKRRRRQALLFPLAAVLLAGGAPAVAEPVPAGASDGDIRSTIAAAIAAGRAEDCPGALRLLDPIVPRLDAGAERNAVQRLRLVCLAPVGRANELGPVQRELAAAMPRDGLVRSYGVIIAASEGRFADAAETLAGIAEDDPQSLVMVSGGSWRGIAQKLTEERRFDLRDRVFVALARADWQPADQPDMRDGLAQGAIQALLARGEADEASALLFRVEMPELLASMASERLYQPLWPAIEARMGPHSVRAVDCFAAARLEDFARNPDNDRVRRDAIRAFILLGRFTEAAEAAAAIPIVEGMGEDDVTSVRYQAQALAALGRRSEAVARMRGFARLDPKKTPDAAAGLVGLAELLDENAQPEEALAVARGALTRGKDALSPWGRGWLRRTEACALSALGRPLEAQAAGDLLRSTAGDNPAAAIEGLLCLQRSDEAASIAIKTLETSEGASSIADQFQPDGAIWAPAESRLRGLWAAFLKRRDVRAAFDRRARILPIALWPERGARPIPRKRSLDPAGPIA